MAYGAARPVGVHEPRGRLRAAARRGAPRATYVDRDAHQRPADRRADRRRSSSSSTRARGATCSATTRASTVVLFGAVDRERDRVVGPPAAPACSARCCASARRRSRPTPRRSRSTSSTAPTCCTPSRPTPPACTRCAAKLSTVVIVAVRGFQAAWPPLAYSVTDEAQAARLYARVTTRLRAVTGIVVAAWRSWGAGRSGCWPATRASTRRRRRCRGSRSAGRCTASCLVLITVAGRAKVTTRNFPAALAGLVVNVVAARHARRAARDRGRRHRAGRRLRRDRSPCCTADARPVPRAVRVGAAGDRRRGPGGAGGRAASCCCRTPGAAGLVARLAWLAGTVPLLVAAARRAPGGAARARAPPARSVRGLTAVGAKLSLWCVFLRRLGRLGCTETPVATGAAHRGAR